ncbi:hypothetical protein Tco_1199442 [Tanacetum coccineum]
MHRVQVQLVMGELRTEWGMLIQVKLGRLSATTATGVVLDEEQLLFLAGGQDNAIDEDVEEQPVQDLALNMDNVFQADDCDAYNSDIDKVPWHRLCSWLIYHPQILFMMKLVRLMIRTFYLRYMTRSLNQGMIFCELMKTRDALIDDNAVPVVQSNVSSVSNDAYMMIFNDMHEPHAQSVSDTTQNTVVDNSLTAELATYKEQVELYEKRARFELTKREQKIDEQLRIVITDRNIKEENLKKELLFCKNDLLLLINHNKSM